MSKPAIDQPTHSNARPEAEPPVTPEVEAVIRERLATYDEDRKTARPAAEVRGRLMRRHPAP